jgi:hypothetical protein
MYQQQQQEAAAAAALGPVPMYTMWQYYEDFWRPFGELLTQMETVGVMVNR